MLKACTLIRRKKGMSIKTFQTYWRNTHADIVRKLPLVKKYVQSHPLINSYDKNKLPYDGLAEIWVENTDALRTLADTKEYKDVAADESNFIDSQNTELLLTDEHIIKDGIVPTLGVKKIEFVKKNSELEVEEFQHYWKNIHGLIATDMHNIRRYTQSHTKKSGYKRSPLPRWDGIAITWFDSLDAMGKTTGALDGLRSHDDGIELIQSDETSSIITSEHVIV